MAKPVTVSIPHQLGRTEAKRRIDEGFADLSRHLGAGAVGRVERAWQDDRMSFAFTTLGQAISGQVAVTDTAVTVEVLLPGFLAMIAGQVKGAVKKKANCCWGRNRRQPKRRLRGLSGELDTQGDHPMPRKQTEKEAKRAFTHGSGGANADMAVEAAPIHEDRHIETPHAREAEPLKEGEKHDHMAAREKSAEDRQEALLDEALEETFPGSDPISPKHIT